MVARREGARTTRGERDDTGGKVRPRARASKRPPAGPRSEQADDGGALPSAAPSACTELDVWLEGGAPRIGTLFDVRGEYAGAVVGTLPADAPCRGGCPDAIDIAFERALAHREGFATGVGFVVGWLVFFGALHAARRARTGY